MLKLITLFLVISFGVGAMVAAGSWTVIRSSYMERHGIKRHLYFFWKPQELPTMLREGKTYTRYMLCGLGVAFASLAAILLLSAFSD
jgi:hypothetical protein